MPSGITVHPSTISMQVLYKYFFLLIVLVSSCQLKPRRSFLPNIAGYNEQKKDLMILDKGLLEISGMFYLPDGSIAANNDEDGVIFKLNLQDGRFETFSFTGKGDYEDLVKVNNNFYVLESKGNIHIVEDGNKQNYREVKFPKKKKIEFESLYHDKNANKLVLVSKDHSEGSPGILAYAFDLAMDTFTTKPWFFIPMKTIFMAAKNNNADCKPSAAAIQPITNDLFIIASVGKLLLQCTSDGKMKRAYKINPSQFPQPEGITFAPNGDMYISNEGLNGKATILKFPYEK